jgi:hypothetical protein
MEYYEKTINDLKEKLGEEISVKEGEVLINKELKILTEKLELQIDLLNKINDRLYKEVAELRFRIKKIIFDKNET